MEEFTLGQPVVFHPWDTLRRRSKWPGGHYCLRFWAKEVPPSERGNSRLFEPPALRHGIVVGKRMLADGKVTGGYDEPLSFTPSEHFEAYLVAFDLRRKPSLLRPEDIHPE